MFFQSINCFSQDLEPHTLSSIPTGGNFAIASYGYSTGNILVDNTLPIEDLNASLNNMVFAYARSFKLFNRLAKFDVIAPYSFGTFKGVVNSVDSSTSRHGLADPLLRFSIIFIGGRAFGLSDFVKQQPSKFKLGATFRLRMPLGQYDPTKFLNLGANRWAFKVGVSGSYTFFKKLTLETHLNSWFFTKNRDFLNGNTISQKPLLSVQFHITYVFKPGMWVAVSGGMSGMGQTSVNGAENSNAQSSSRFGAAFAYRFDKHNSLKIALTSGLISRYGANFTTLLLAYQFMWFDKN